MATWHDETSARDQWPDAPVDEDDGDTQLVELLAVARAAVLAYAPVLADEEVIPDSYRVGQLMQARNIWNSSKAQPSGEFDNGSYGLSSFPLDWQVRQLLRPKQGRPVIA
jgi:hypothetical protein